MARLTSFAQDTCKSAMTLVTKWEKAISRQAHSLYEAGCDLYTAITEPKAMPAHKRRLDEFKAAAGGALVALGIIEVSPVTAAGGAIPAWEAVQDLEQAGHKWRSSHERHTYGRRL